MSRCGDGMQLDAIGFEHLTVLQSPEWLIAVGRLPQHGVGGIEQYRRVEIGAQLRRHGDVVIVAVGTHHRHHMTPGDGVLDGLCVMRRVDDDDLGAVTDDPDVVVDFPVAAVEREGAVGDDPLDTGLVGGH